MAKGDKTLVFTKDFAVHKKGGKATFSRDLSSMLIGKGVAKVYEPKKTKSKK